MGPMKKGCCNMAIHLGIHYHWPLTKIFVWWKKVLKKCVGSRTTIHIPLSLLVHLKFSIFRCMVQKQNLITKAISRKLHRIMGIAWMQRWFSVNLIFVWLDILYWCHDKIFGNKFSGILLKFEFHNFFQNLPWLMFLIQQEETFSLRYGK